MRNALIVAGNKGDPALRPLIERYCQHEDPLLRETAHWALARLTAQAEDNGCLTENNDAYTNRAAKVHKNEYAR